MYNGWNQCGGYAGDITNAALTNTAALNYIDIPFPGNIHDFEVLVDTIAAGATGLKLGLYHDSGGLKPIKGDGTSDMAQTLSVDAAGTSGGCTFAIDVDYFPLAGVETQASIHPIHVTSGLATTKMIAARIYYKLTTVGAGGTATLLAATAKVRS